MGVAHHMNRPTLEPGLAPTNFRQHRWLKTELQDFCAAHGLPTDGGKHALLRRVAAFLAETQRDPERG